LGLTSIDRIIQHLNAIARNTDSLTSYIGRFAIIALLVIPFIFQITRLITMSKNGDPRYSIYRAAGIWLHNRSLPDASIGALEVGIIGYYSERPMIDFAGLIQPEIASSLDYQTTYADAANYAVKRFQPDYLVLPGGTFPELEKGYANRNCQIVQNFEGAHYNYANNLVVYDCSPAR
jgi:hypothetical protein